MQKESKPLIVVLLSSVLFGLLSFFGYSPDPQLSSDVVAYSDQAANAISMKNWLQLATVLVSFGAAVFVWWKTRSNARTLS